MVYEITRTMDTEIGTRERAIIRIDEAYFSIQNVEKILKFIQDEWNRPSFSLRIDRERLFDAKTSNGRDGSEVDHNEGRPPPKDMAGESKFTVGTHHSAPAILYRGVVVQFLDVDRIAELCDNIDEHLK